MKVIFMLGDTHRYIEEEEITNVSNSEDRIRPNFSQVFVAFSVSLCSCMVGFTSAWSAPALPSMLSPNSSLTITLSESSWIGSLMPLSALIGGLFGGPLIDAYGRHSMIVFTAIPVILSYILIAFATNVSMVFGGRVMSGFCVGICSLALPVYMGETVLPKIRGVLGLMPTLFGNGGILICFMAGSHFEWRGLSAVGIVISIPYVVCMSFVPETPQWYVSRERHRQGRKALRWLRGVDSDICEEYLGIERGNEFDRSKGPPSFSTLFSKIYIKPMIIALGLMFFQQMSGINAFLFYAVQFFKEAGSSIDGHLSTIIIGLVNILASALAAIFIDITGRKVLLCLSSFLMFCMLICVGLYFRYKDEIENLSKFGWIPLVALITYIIGFSIGFGPIPWLMLGEILPAKIRGYAASIATAFNWSCTFIITKTFLELINWVGFSVCCWFYAVMCILAFFFVIFLVPETRGMSLEDIEKKILGTQSNVPVRKVKRTTSKAYLKPFPLYI